MRVTKDLWQRIVALLLGIGLSTTGVNAETFFSDLFDYPDGQLTASEVGGMPGDNVSGGLWTAHSGETFEDNVDVIGGQAQVLNSGSEDVNRDSGRTMAVGDKWYYGALVTVNFTGTPGDGLNNDYFIHFKDDTTFGFRTRVYIDDPNTAGNDYTLGLSGSSGGQAAKWPSDLPFGGQIKIMASYDYDSGESTLWVNPVDENSASISDTAGDMTGINALALRQDFLGGTANNEILVNAVAMGDDFNDVMAGLVPEPGAAVLSALALLGILLTYRRR